MAQHHRRKQATVYVVTVCHSTDGYTHDSNDCYSLRVLLRRLVNSEWHWNCTAHFRYHGSVEYRDTRDGIIIVAPISGIVQHYYWGRIPSGYLAANQRPTTNQRPMKHVWAAHGSPAGGQKAPGSKVRVTVGCVVGAPGTIMFINRYQKNQPIYRQCTCKPLVSMPFGNLLVVHG